jgi:phosphatidylcholine synthase
MDQQIKGRKQYDDEMPNQDGNRSARSKGYAVHLLTASGAVLGMLALQAVINKDPRGAMLWLVASQILDGLDGPIARRFDVSIHAPRFDGQILDLVIDYVTCVVVPTIFMLEFKMLPERYAIYIAGLIFISSALWFSRSDLETEEHWFRGFPAVWNLAVATMFICNLNYTSVGIISVLLCASQFTSIQIPHIVRATWFRSITLPFGCLYILALTYASYKYPNFENSVGNFSRALLIIFPVYIAVLSIAKTLFKSKAIPVASDQAVVA